LILLILENFHNLELIHLLLLPLLLLEHFHLNNKNLLLEFLLEMNF
jgi:hypothetical protein